MPDRLRSSPQGWLALGPASRLLGVDPDTLRRWADEGRVTVYLTPGGHRRFERAALERVMAARRGRSPRSSLSRLGATPERLSRAYRRSYAAREAQPPVALGHLERAAFRDDGRRLIEALVAHVDATGPAASRRTEEEAGALTEEVARRMARAGASLNAAVAQFVAARRPLLAEIGSLAARRSLDSASLTALFQSASDLLDRLLLRLVASYLEAADAAKATAPKAGAGMPQVGGDQAAPRRAAPDGGQ